MNRRQFLAAGTAAGAVLSRPVDLYSFPVGQSVCDVNEEATVRDVMVRLQTEYLDAMERLMALNREE